MRYVVMFLTLGLSVCSFSQTTEIRSAQALDGVMKASRNPLPSDPVLLRFVTGERVLPDASWKPIAAKADGWFESELLENAYVYASVESDTDRIALLDASGHSLVYVNGEMRGGDPYGNGYLTLPIKLHKGPNDLVFVSGRGRIRASVIPVVKPVDLDLRDLTAPDILTTDKGEALASIVVRNSTEAACRNLKIQVKTPDGRTATSSVPTVMSLSIRKANVAIPVPAKPLAGDLKLSVSLISDGKVIDTSSFSVGVRNPNQLHKRTFVSQIDGSVQYYAVQPAQKPSPKNMLTLSVHGAGVEALGQAAAYGAKDDVSVVAATNRRPFGFDWEDVGRLDALEVLAQAKKTILHDPARVHITGHSMGGHGTWHIGTLYPDTFASLGPAAGWISFWSYAGGWTPPTDEPTLALLRRSMNAGDTLARLSNTLAQGVFILHGDADDNVPVEQARTMKAELEKIHHPDLGYHEVPKAGHWFGNESVDWPGIFAMERRRVLDPFPLKIDFTTPNPAVSSHAWWAEVVQQERAMEPSRIELEVSMGAVVGKTSNVSLLHIDWRNRSAAPAWVALDGQIVVPDIKDIWLRRQNGRWELATKPNTSQKVPARSGPFKNVFNNRFVLVVATGGTADEKAWAIAKARYDSETWDYRGNGSIEVVLDTELTKLSGWKQRNLVLYGNSSTNRAWAVVLGDSPVAVAEGAARVGPKSMKGSLSLLMVRPMRGASDSLVATIGGSDLAAMRRCDRLPIFTSGLAYPDWILIGESGVAGDGFFGNDWRLETGTTAWAK